MSRGVALAVLGALLLSGCVTSARAEARAQGRLLVVTSAYPLQFVAERVGGDRTAVTDLARPGAEPHELELSPRDVAAVEDADLVVFLRGFQPAVDQAVASSAGDRGLDVAPTARLVGKDPHFWLDPTRLADVGDALAARLARVSPADAATFRANARALRADLTALDADLTSGLADCRSRQLVTGHEAFGYLARRYGLEQVGVSGLDPEAEPDAAALARVAGFVRRKGVHVVYTETLASPAVARALAAETGVRTAVLDPIESRPESGDYLTAMRADLAVLRAGQECS